MGTNFYVKVKLTSKQKDEIRHYLLEDRYDIIRALLDEAKDIHIGKSSFGWKFLWDVNNFKYSGKSKKEMFDWLKDKDIIDEYDKHYTFDQFIKRIRITEGYDLESYYKDNPDSYPDFPYYNIPIEFPSKGLNINQFCEFYLDDCRCTCYTDFN